MEYKICRICGKKLPTTNEYFYKRKDGSKDGFRNECKKCNKTRQQNRQKEECFKEKRKKWDKKYWNNNKDRISKEKSQYRKEHNEEIKEKDKLNRIKYHSKILEASKRYDEKNKEKKMVEKVHTTIELKEENCHTH